MESTTETSSDESFVNKNAKRYVCSYNNCEATFTKNRKLVNHIRRHTFQRPFVCDEPNCKKTYTNSSHLKRHKLLHAQEIERVPCTVEGCCKELSNNWNLKRHINRFHNKDRLYSFHCKECNQGFHRKRQLQQHSYLHTGELPFKCDCCKAKFASVRDCNRHKRTHTIYTCECGDEFERWTSLLAHRKICNNNSIQCRICEKRFAHAGNLKSHIETHIDKDDRNVFMCPYKNCSKYYFYSKNLNCHIKRIHKKIAKPKIPCKYENCDKLFSKMQNYKYHLLRHEEPIKPKGVRKPRKDKGTFRKSTIPKLCGVNLPVETSPGVELNVTVISDINVENNIIQINEENVLVD